MIHLLLAVIYLSFISLGLPDSVLGAAWPAMYGELGVPISYAGALSLLIALGTVVSSLQSDRLTKALGAGKVTAISVAMTALALFGFSISHSFWVLCLWAIPYGLGAGSVDTALNNYVALHYTSKHMSWLHCMWGIGASIGPYIMGYALSGGLGWGTGYRLISYLQLGLTAVLLLSLPLWNVQRREAAAETAARALPLRQLIRIPGAWETMTAFFFYCAIEQTTGLWASSYLVARFGLSADTAARAASLFFLGITVGRILSGFLTMRLQDAQMVRLGQGILFLAVVSLLLPLGTAAAMIGFLLLGLGCAPIYPCLIHATPQRFGADRSQALIGVQMASAYVGTCAMPPLFGLLAKAVSPSLLPLYLAVMLLLMFGAHEWLLRVVKRQGKTPSC